MYALLKKTNTLAIWLTSMSIFTFLLLYSNILKVPYTMRFGITHTETVSRCYVVSVVVLLLVWFESLTLRQLLTSGQEIMLFSIHSELPQNSFGPPKNFWLPESWHILLNPLYCHFFFYNVNISINTYSSL